MERKQEIETVYTSVRERKGEKAGERKRGSAK